MATSTYPPTLQPRPPSPVSCLKGRMNLFIMIYVTETVTYLLELLIGRARVPQEAVGVEDAAGVVFVAPQVVAGCKVSSS